MKNRRQISLDRISALPEDISAKILSHMPIRDALRTSILSKKWRFCWRRMPKLVFEDNMVNVSFNIPQIKKYKLVNAIFHVLLLHRAPILEFSLIVNADIYSEMDQIISHLSWRNSIKEIILALSPINEYKLPFSFFSFQGLEHLDLTNCEFELPVKFNGFSMLKSLIFEDVNITTNMLQRFLINCPLLEEFTLMGYRQKEFVGKKCTILKLFKCLPSVRIVKMTNLYMKHFAGGGTRQKKLPTSLVHLRGLELDVCFQKQDEVSSTLCVIGSSPNLERIEIKMVHYVGQPSAALLDPQDYSGLILDHLEELEITSFYNYATEIEFVKLIMSKSPKLKKARIELGKYVSVDEENKMLRDFLYMPFPRASPAAKFIIERHQKLPANAN